MRIDAQLGLEPTPDAYVTNLVQVFGEVWRVLKYDGVVWLVIGDSYCSTAPGTMGDPLHQRGILSSVSDGRAIVSKKLRPETPPGLKPKDLCGIPWRVAFALQDAGWYLRSDVIWSKPAPMPESVTDRPTRAHEYVFLLTKNSMYYYDATAILEPSMMKHKNRYTDGRGDKDAGYSPHRKAPGMTDPEYRNKRSVWTVNTQPYRGSHFATFPPDLIKPMILAGSRVGDTVLDPFAGSGTTGMVSTELGRKSVLIELNPSYVEMIKVRTNVTSGML